jgi:hypothetical protein
VALPDISEQASLATPFKQNSPAGVGFVIHRAIALMRAVCYNGLMKFKKGKNAQEMGQKGGKKTLKTYGFGYMRILAKKRWAVDKSLLQKDASGDKIKI